MIKPGRSGWGRVKRREYLQYLISVRDEEHQARMLGLKIEAKSIEQVGEQYAHSRF